LSWLVIVATNAPLSAALGETMPMPAFDIAWGYQAGYIIASIFGFWLIIEGLRYVEASIGGLLGLLEIVFSIMFGFIIFGEVLTGIAVAGGAIILCAAALPHIASLLAARRSA
jgi:drug/metabolite transporter (DMT)-like permease